ncbi:plasmid replication protein, CyRepA1 family [Vibrio alfacsensis]|uniref:plasmid replication protein, CyRepA1 family n=1 Tax=Vibrio alfacsensis TaxID=1074311 RepID=UPI0040679E79
MKGIFQDICNKTSSDVARFELVKAEVEKRQGELSHRNNAEFFFNEAKKIFSEGYFQVIAQELQNCIAHSIRAFNERATSSISVRRTKEKHRHFKLNDISEALRVLSDEDNLIVAQAPHASGKTSKLALPLIQNEQGKVVYTSHLRSIINSACERLQLVSYLDATNDVRDHLLLGFTKEVAYQSLNSHQLKMAICLNSIIGVLDDLLENADLLVIDEFTQVLSSVADSNLENFAHEYIFHKLVSMIRTGKRVVVLDADMNDLAIEFVEYCRPTARFQFFEQSRLPNGINVDFCLCKGKFSAQNEILLRVIQDLHYGHRVVIATDSFQVSKDLKEQVESLYPNKTILLVNAKTTATVEVKSFQDNNQLSLERHNYDVLIFSPALTSGISIEKEHFDTGYGCFTGNSIISSDAIQMLRRVRNLKEYFVSVSADVKMTH